MRKLWVVGFLGCFLISGTSFASSSATLPVPLPPAPNIGASSYVLMDFQSGQILAEKNPDTHRAPASTTKLMVAYIVFHELAAGRITLQTKFPVSKKAWSQGGSRMFLKLGSQVSVNDLLQGLLIPSGNDAAVVLAQGIAGTTQGFVTLMNAYAQQLGLTDTHYADVNGLPRPGLYTSALDLAKLSDAIIKQFPQYYHYFKEKSFTWNHIRQYNYNKMLWLDPTVDGLKTGYTKEAGYCLVGSAKRGSRRMIAVVMGVNEPKATSKQNYIHLARVDDSLLNYGFRFFSTHKLYSKGQVLKKIQVWDGKRDKVPAGLSKDLYVSIPDGQYHYLQAQLHVSKSLNAPVSKNQIVGKLTVKLGHKVLKTVPVETFASDPRGNLWQRLHDTLRKWLSRS